MVANLFRYMLDCYTLKTKSSWDIRIDGSWKKCLLSIAIYKKS